MLWAQNNGPRIGPSFGPILLKSIELAPWIPFRNPAKCRQLFSHHDHAAHEDEESPDARDDALLPQHVPVGRSLRNVAELEESVACCKG